MTFRKRWAFIAGTAAIFVAAVFFMVKPPQSAPSPKIHADSISAYLKDGDIICRMGNRLWSEYFKDISIADKRYSHLGIIRIADSKITVIHAEGHAAPGKDYVTETTLNEFLEIAKAIGIYRLNDYGGKPLSSTALEYIGYPFDWNFDLADEGKIYCTELLYAVLKKAAPEIQLTTLFQKELKKEIIPLEAVSNSKLFTEIVYVRTSEQ